MTIKMDESVQVFSGRDAGCYADGTFGAVHAREVMANLLRGIRDEHYDAHSHTRATITRLVFELDDPMSDDDGESLDALDVLNAHTADGLAWEFVDGDLMLLPLPPCECGAEWSEHSAEHEVCPKDGTFPHHGERYQAIDA